MENELWVTLKGELVIHVMDPSLRHQNQRADQRNGEDGTFDVGVICGCSERIRAKFQGKLIPYLVVNRILLCIADPFEQRRFASIRPTNNENAKVGIFGS